MQLQVDYLYQLDLLGQQLIEIPQNQSYHHYSHQKQKMHIYKRHEKRIRIKYKT
jgi:hypothetical protein